MEQAKEIVIGDPMAELTQMGPLCTVGQLEKARTEVAHAIEQGATLLCGGKQPAGLDGYFFEPTILDCQNNDFRIADTELFGPILSVFKFADEEEAIRLANDTKHGLAAGLFTRDNARTIRVTNKIRAGMIWVNTYRAVSPIVEVGGFKTSGYGRESGFQAIYDYTRSKTVWMNTSSDPLPSQFVAR